MHCMNTLAIQLLDLPDELLIIILGKFDPNDVLYLLFGLNKRLDKIVLTVAHHAIIFNGSIVNWSSQSSE